MNSVKRIYQVLGAGIEGDGSWDHFMGSTFGQMVAIVNRNDPYTNGVLGPADCYFSIRLVAHDLLVIGQTE